MCLGRNNFKKAKNNVLYTNTHRFRKVVKTHIPSGHIVNISIIHTEDERIEKKMEKIFVKQYSEYY